MKLRSLLLTAIMLVTGIALRALAGTGSGTLTGTDSIASDSASANSIASGSATADSSSVTPAGPKLRLDARKVDFGVIEPGSWHVDSLGFTNVGDTPLVITDIFSSCGCTATYYSKEPVMPGSRAYITVKYKSDRKAVGTFRKSVRVRSNAVNPSEVFMVEGRVRNPNKPVSTAAPSKSDDSSNPAAR